MNLTLIYWLVAGVLAFLYLLRVGAPQGRTRTMLKTLSVLGLAVVALLGGGFFLLVGALVACAVGDAFLSRDGEGPLKAGMIAFAIGHLIYIALFLNLGGGIGVEPWRIGLQVLVVLGAAGFARWLWPSLGVMRAPVAGYLVVVALMTLLAIGLPSSQWLVTVGAVMFLTSDALLAGEMFKLDAASPARRWTSPMVWLLYWGGQAAITAGLLYPAK